MPRLRTVKPEFFQNEDLAEVSMGGRLLFIGLWTLADRRGIVEDRPKRIKAVLFPYDDIDVDASLQVLAQRGFIRRYESDGIKGIHIVKFLDHQNPHVNERENEVPAPKSTIQAPEQHHTSTVLEPDQPDTSTNQDSPLLVKTIGHRGVGSGHRGIDSLSPDGDELESTKPKYSDDFDSFWLRYPTGHGTKKTAYAQWLKLKPPERAALPAALESWIACERWQAGYIKACELWIRDRLWEQEPPAPKPTNVTSMNRNGRMSLDEHIAGVREAEERERRQALGGQA